MGPMYSETPCIMLQFIMSATTLPVPSPHCDVELHRNFLVVPSVQEKKESKCQINHLQTSTFSRQMKIALLFFFSQESEFTANTMIDGMKMGGCFPNVG